MPLCLMTYQYRWESGSSMAFFEARGCCTFQPFLSQEKQTLEDSEIALHSLIDMPSVIIARRRLNQRLRIH